MDDDSIFSVDRLVEFGIGMAVAQQMVSMFSQAVNPVTPPAMPVQGERNFYVSIGGDAAGPLDGRELLRLYADRKIDKDTLGWMPGMQAWKPVGQIPQMLKVFALG